MTQTSFPGQEIWTAESQKIVPPPPWQTVRNRNRRLMRIGGLKWSAG